MGEQQAFDAARRVGMVDAVYASDLERATHTAEINRAYPEGIFYVSGSYADFLEAYAHNRGGGLHIMQGHAGAWGDDRWEQFVKIVDFLIAQKAEFLMPRDFAKNPPGPVR